MNVLKVLQALKENQSAREDIFGDPWWIEMWCSGQYKIALV
jgi:hypothetical protein